MSIEFEIGSVPDEVLWEELVRRGAAVRCGYAYPAQASDPGAAALIAEHGYAYGPWQLLEDGHKLAGDGFSWPVFAAVPGKFRRPVLGSEG